jgi:hypothetical protein
VRWCQEFEHLGRFLTNLQSAQDPRKELDSKWKQTVSDLSFLVHFQESFDVLGDLDLDFRIKSLRHNLKNGAPFCAESLAYEIAGIRNQVSVALADRQFIYVEPLYAQYYKQGWSILGERVCGLFPKAAKDVMAVSTCLAANLPTACVFHLMRVSELGLRELAKHLRVNIKDKGKNIPIEYGSWDKVITGCNNQIQKLRQRHADQKKNVKLELYSEAAQHCTFMKDIWRNNISHARAAYAFEEAVSCLGRVRDFMQFLTAVLGDHGAPSKQ